MGIAARQKLSVVWNDLDIFLRILAFCLCFFCCLSAYAQEQTNAVLLTNIGIWDGSSGEVRNGQHILIIAGEIVEAGSEKPRAPSGTQIMDGSGHVAVGAITPGRIANFVVFDASPLENISVFARADLHTQLLVKDGELLENHYAVVRQPGPDVDDADHMPLRVIEANNGWASIAIGGIISVDGVDTIQDDESEQQIGDLTEYRGAGLTAARFVIYGHLGRNNPFTYYSDWGYNGFEEGFDVTEDDEYSLYNLELTFPEMRIGKLTVGRMKAPTTISRVSGGAYLPTAFRQAPISALTKSRDNGVRLTNTAFDKRITWGMGVFNDWLVDGRSMSDTNTYVTGRVSGLVFDDKSNDHLLELGLGMRWTDFVEDSIRFRARPGVPFVPNFLDTGDMQGDEARWLTGELAWRKRNFMVTAEHVRTKLDSPTIGDPTFSGSYVWFEWTLTGETRSWNYDKAVFGRPLPSRDFTKGGKGLWSFAFAVNDTDLNEGMIDGGDMQQVMLGINWYPSKSFRWGLAYGRTWLDRDGLDSTTDFLHLFIHLSNL
jgi:phosphate-selective porin OprO/OprP